MSTREAIISENSENKAKISQPIPNTHYFSFEFLSEILDFMFVSGDRDGLIFIPD